MGVIYRARDLKLNRLVALKLMLAGQFASDREVKRFKTEAEAAARLHHPNIVPIYEFGGLQGRPFLSMRFVDGENLAQRLHEKPMDAIPAARLMSKLARAIHYAHQRGILHRDLKPANVLLDSTGEPHVTDFGLAKCLHSNDGLTLTGSLLGSPNFMSPEQAAGNPDRLTTAADIYSLGAILYELLTGQPPFQSETPLETIRKVAEEPPVAPHLICKSADPELETICLKCMEKEPAQRYGSADALAEDLERWLHHEPIQARPVGVIGRVRKWTARKPMTATLVMLSGLTVLAFIVGQTVMSVRLSRANKRVKTVNADLTRTVYEAQWRQADDAVRAGERAEAIARFSYFARENPNDATAAARLLSLVSSYNFPVPQLPPLAHEAPITTLDFARDGVRLVTGTSGGTARVWNLQSGKMEFELPHPGALSQCIFCGEKDDKLFTMSSEPKVRLWDLNTRRLIFEHERGHLSHAWPDSFVATRDRRRFAINIQSNLVDVLDAEIGAWLPQPFQIADEIWRYDMSKDGTLLAVASAKQVFAWRIQTGKSLFEPIALNAPPEQIRFSEDGRWLACLCQNKIWVMNTQTGAREPEFSADALGIAFLGGSERLITIPSDPSAPLGLFDPHTGTDCGSPFGQPDFDPQRHGTLFFSSRDQNNYFPSSVRLLDPATGRSQLEPFVHDGPISATLLRADGRVAATGSQDRTVRIWSTQMRQPEPLTIAAGEQVLEAQWSPSGDRIFSASFAKGKVEAKLWDAQSGRPLGKPGKLDDTIFFGQWAPDGTRFATASIAGSARIWNGTTGRAISPPLRQQSRQVHCAFSPDGKLLATASEDRTVRFWDGHTGAAVGQPLVHSHNPLKISFSSDSGRIATASMDGTIRVWSVPDGKLLVGPLRHGGICWVAAFSPDDRWLISASSDGTAQLWDAATGQPVLPAFRHEGPVLWASFRPDGRAIATSTQNGIIRVWDAATGQLLAEPMRQTGAVWFVKWSPDGKSLATTSIGGAACVWDAFTGHLAAEPFRHEAEVRRAEFSPDGRRLLTASYDGKIKIWDLALLRPPLPVPEWVPALAESLGGKQIGPRDSMEAVPGDTFQLVKARIDNWGSNNFYGRWGKWMLQGRSDRPLKAFNPQ